MLSVPPLMWAGNAVVGRMMVGSIGPLWLNALRWLVAFALLLPLGWRVLATAEARAEISARWQYLAILGLLGVGAYNALQYMALRTSTPLNVTLIASSSPVWAMLIGALAYGVRPGRLQYVGAALSLAGVGLVLSRGAPGSLLQIELVEGDLLILLAIIGWSLYSWMLARPPQHMVGEARPAWDWAGFLVAQCVFGLGWAVASAGVGDLIATPVPIQWSWQLMLAIVFMAVGPSVIAYRLWALAVQEAGPTMAAAFYNLTPLFAALLSAAMIGEWPQSYHGLAFALIVAGIMVSSRSTPKPAK
jgi:drug/metabolite transporter (DMT)-like permease